MVPGVEKVSERVFGRSGGRSAGFALPLAYHETPRSQATEVLDMIKDL